MTDARSIHRVLVIAYYFPPLALSGVQRTLKFVKYLPDFDWHPTVLTVEDRGYFAKDSALLDELGGLPVNIRRTQSLDPLHYMRSKNVVRMPGAATLGFLGKISQTLFVPDNKIGWMRKAVAECMRIIKQDSIDVIYATAPPWTDLLIGVELKRRSGLPLLIDYRDAWLDNPLHFYPTPLHKALHRRLEHRALKAADKIITINRPIKERMLRSYDLVSHNDISIIPQGFDQQDFEGLTRQRAKDGKLRILYSGIFYYNRGPENMMLALQALGEKRPETRDRIELHIVGSARDGDIAMARRLGLESQVVTHGYLPHREAVQRLVDADVLWLTIGRGRGEEMMSTGKLYEYLGAMKPILATIPDGAAHRTLEKCGAVFFASPDDPESIMGQLNTLFDLHKNNTLPSPSYEFVSQFERKALTGRLATMLVQLVDTDAAHPRVHTRRAGERSQRHNPDSSITNASSP